MKSSRVGDILYLVVPCYNEEEVLEHTAEVMKNKLERMAAQGKISIKSKVFFVNDGSSDKTWKIISDLCRCDSIFSGLCFSRNYGHQSAILAGMMAAREHADMVVTIDADLQQDIEALDKFVKCYQEGCEVLVEIRR